MRWQDDDAVQRALSTRTRAADTKEVSGFKGWVGPGTLIAEKDDSLWISLRGYLAKASRSQVRKATSEENLGAELVHHLSAQMIKDLENNSLRHFRDVIAEGDPRRQRVPTEAVPSPVEEPGGELIPPRDPLNPVPEDPMEAEAESAQAPSTGDPPSECGAKSTLKCHQSG